MNLFMMRIIFFTKIHLKILILPLIQAKKHRCSDIRLG